LRRADVGNDVAAVDDERSLAHLAKRGVESRAAFRLVDLLSGKECRDPAREACRVCVRDEQAEGVFAKPLLRKIEQPAIPLERQPLEPLGIARKKLRERRAGERAPGLGEIGRGNGGHRSACREGRVSEASAGHRSPEHSRSRRHFNACRRKGVSK
jgi:hypothetical protein